MPRRKRVYRPWSDAEGPTPEQRESLMWGDTVRGRGAFANDRTRRAAWQLEKASLMSRCTEGRRLRPRAWWDYEAPAERDDRIREERQLFELGLLTPDEVKRFELRWLESEARAFEHAEERARWEGATATAAGCYYRACAEAQVPMTMRRKYPGATKADLAFGEPADPREFLRGDWAVA